MCSGKMSIPTPTISDFDFGLDDRHSLELPADEPAPTRWLLYTAWHVNRALECFSKNTKGYIIPNIFATFKVHPKPPQPRLEAIY